MSLANGLHFERRLFHQLFATVSVHPRLLVSAYLDFSLPLAERPEGRHERVREQAKGQVDSLVNRNCLHRLLKIRNYALLADGHSPGGNVARAGFMADAHLNKCSGPRRGPISEIESTGIDNTEYVR